MPTLTLTLIFLAIGVLLFIVEMFTPGLGVSGVLGTVSLLVAVLLQIGNPVGIVYMIALVLFLLAVMLMIFLWITGRDKFDKSALVLKASIDGTSTNLKDEDMQAFLGQAGTAVTPLRPAGKIEIDGEMHMLDVSTSGEFLPAGTRVTIQKVEGLRILVHAMED